MFWIAKSSVTKSVGIHHRQAFRHLALCVGGESAVNAKRGGVS